MDLKLNKFTPESLCELMEIYKVGYAFFIGPNEITIYTVNVCFGERISLYILNKTSYCQSWLSLFSVIEMSPECFCVFL